LARLENRMVQFPISDSPVSAVSEHEQDRN
jgi:hypothetical protein